MSNLRPRRPNVVGVSSIQKFLSTHHTSSSLKSAIFHFSISSTIHSSRASLPCTPPPCNTVPQHVCPPRYLFPRNLLPQLSGCAALPASTVANFLSPALHSQPLGARIQTREKTCSKLCEMAELKVYVVFCRSGPLSTACPSISTGDVVTIRIRRPYDNITIPNLT